MRNKDPKRENHKQLRRSKSSCQKEKQSKLDNWYDKNYAYLNK